MTISRPERLSIHAAAERFHLSERELRLRLPFSGGVLRLGPTIVVLAGLYRGLHPRPETGADLVAGAGR